MLIRYLDYLTPPLFIFFYLSFFYHWFFFSYSKQLPSVSVFFEGEKIIISVYERKYVILVFLSLGYFLQMNDLHIFITEKACHCEYVTYFLIWSCLSRLSPQDFSLMTSSRASSWSDCLLPQYSDLCIHREEHLNLMIRSHHFSRDQISNASLPHLAKHM